MVQPLRLLARRLSFVVGPSILNVNVGVSLYCPVTTFLISMKPLPPVGPMQTNGLLLAPLPADGYEQRFTSLAFAGRKVLLIAMRKVAS